LRHSNEERNVDDPTAEESDNEDVIEPEMFKFETEEEKKEAIGNLVADDEWMGLSMELGELVRVAVIEDLKRNARDFLGKDDYKVSGLMCIEGPWLPIECVGTRFPQQISSLLSNDEGWRYQ